MENQEENTDVAAADCTRKTKKAAPRRPRYFSVFLKIAILVCICMICASLCILSIHMIVLMLRWTNESRRFRYFSEVGAAILNFYQEQFYLWYLTIRNWSCHTDGKIQVVLPRYMVS